MSNTVVVYHSGYGHTQRVAQFVAEGADAQLIAIDADGNLTDAQWADVDAADAIIMGSPTYMGMVSWQFKKFADATSKRWFSSAWKDKVAGWVGQPAMNDGTINRIGSNSGLMAQVGSTSPAEDIPQGDLDTAKAYGKRVSEVASKLFA